MPESADSDWPDPPERGTATAKHRQTNLVLTQVGVGGRNDSVGNTVVFEIDREVTRTGTPGVILGRKAKVLEETTSSNERVVVHCFIVAPKNVWLPK